MAISKYSPGNPASALSASQQAALRSSGVNVDSWVNPGYSGGVAYNPDGSARVSGGAGSALSVTGSSGSSVDDLIKQLRDIQAQNNSWSASQAQRQMDFQAQQALDAMRWNHDEAELSRLWTERMSDTAHQREVKDLQAAGLNPVLSVMGGNGAPVTSGVVASGYAPGQGAMGQTDTSLSGALVNLLGSVMQSQTSLANAALSARTQESVADKYTSMSELVANIQRETSLSVANINSMASGYAARTHADASKVAAAITAAAHRYGYDVMSASNERIAEFNASVNQQLQADRIQADFDLRDAYPTSMFGALSSALGNILSPGDNKGLSSIGDISSALKRILLGDAAS